ncbi:uncharacterized protein BXIN_1181 [Babesia sp. Xinjiang]|uniref:uncharacterized protein n=1 Tax=Babesia sp. Xinjiang TaxID=462227 RepID=UPI000A24A7CE|nr:uncharacterized protein BXIN_1181 [Babesia sp. Xinjiang]ORM40113.1 hypothetical protein BXIN_1181 [Babesia sp. Xinjiang]
MDDFQTVSFMDLLARCVQRCVVDWRCFCYRQVNDESYVDDHARTGIIQFARAQREIFLKLYLLHEFSREQSKLDRVLEGMHLFDNYLEKCGRDIAMNMRKVQASDLLVACPNTALAVDLLSSGRYTRMPTMLPQLAHAATVNSIPMPPLDPDEADLTIERIYSEYRCRFRKAECSRRDVTMECKNGQCVLSHKDLFRITMIYDFASWQALAAVPLLLEKLGHSSEGESRSSFLTLIMYTVAIYNTVKQGNIFDVVFDCANLYSGKVIMERLRGQAADYRTLKLSVTDYRFFVSSEPDRTLLSCSDVVLNDDEYLVLEVYAFPGFREGDVEGLTLKFQMDGRGDINVEVVELQDLLNETLIVEHKLDQWLHRVAGRLERYQLDRINATGNFFMNYATGSLNLMGLPVSFSLAESSLLTRLVRVREALLEFGRSLGLLPADTIPRESLREAWRKDPCTQCSSNNTDSDVITSPAVILNVQLRETVCDFWIYMEEKPGAVHGATGYAIDLNKEIKGEDINVYLTVVTHNEEIAAKKLLVTFGSAPLGVVLLTKSYSEYANARKMLVFYLNFMIQFADICGFATEPLSPSDTKVTGLLHGCEVTVDASGSSYAVMHKGNLLQFKSAAKATEAVRSILNKS